MKKILQEVKCFKLKEEVRNLRNAKTANHSQFLGAFCHDEFLLNFEFIEYENAFTRGYIDMRYKS
jgi:hypothetical protein